jgi:hypothetical protein
MSKRDHSEITVDVNELIQEPWKRRENGLPGATVTDKLKKIQEAVWDNDGSDDFDHLEALLKEFNSAQRAREDAQGVDCLKTVEVRTVKELNTYT